MSITSACTRLLKKVVRLSGSCTMVASGNSECLTAPATETEHAIPSSSTFLSVRSEGMMESGKGTSIDEKIERSKSHWSHLVEVDSDDEEVAEISNVEVFKTLEVYSPWGEFLLPFGEGEGRSLVVGEKFAEGGQAELYHAQVTWNNPENNERDLKNGYSHVLKVFRKGTLLRHLQSQWPLGLLHHVAEKEAHSRTSTEPILRYISCIHFGTLLEDGRFAFILRREEEDLRSLIDRNLTFRSRQDCGPFSEDVAKTIMYSVAFGMEWLHSRSIVHRDLKASNVLLTDYRDERGVRYFIADYECSIGVIGTGFFRAPEILQACKDRNVSKRPELFTKAADIYRYGMTCYEILTGKLPFEGHPTNDYDLVLNGQRPRIPEYVDDWVCRLLSRCWHPNPAARPSFGDILNLLVPNSIGILVDFKKRSKLVRLHFRALDLEHFS